MKNLLKCGRAGTGKVSLFLQYFFARFCTGFLQFISNSWICGTVSSRDC
jgi:hypothetical protein